MKKIILSALFIFISSQSYAQSIGINPVAGSRGLGGDLILGVNDYLKFRVGATSLNYNYHTTHHYTDSNNNSYNFDVAANLKGGSNIIMDLHPFGGTFKISAGIYSMNNNFSASANPTGSNVVFNGQTYAINDVQKIQTDIMWKKNKPYIGFGWDGYRGDKGLFFSSDIGVIVGAPTTKVTLTCSNTPTLGFDCVQANQNAQAEFDNEFTKTQKYLKYYPVIQLGIGYKF